jgi:hypothetical protein
MRTFALASIKAKPTAELDRHSGSREVSSRSMPSGSSLRTRGDSLPAWTSPLDLSSATASTPAWETVIRRGSTVMDHATAHRGWDTKRPDSKRGAVQAASVASDFPTPPALVT